MTSAALASRFRSVSADQSRSDLNQVIARQERSIVELAGPRTSLQFALTPSPTLVAVPFDELERILLALCTAAQHSLDVGGRIVIETRGVNDAPLQAPGAATQTEPPRACIIVRAERARKGSLQNPLGASPPAAGLGSTVLEELVERVGGRLELVPTPDNNLAYVAHLPCAPVGDSSGCMAVAPAQEPGVILLVEDEPQVQAVTARILRAFGYGVITAHNERTALAQAERYGAAISLVVSDLVLPGVSGKELVRRLRQPCEHARVLYISGYSPEHVGTLADGACFLRKPFTAQELLEVVRQLLPESVQLTASNPRP